MAEVEMAFLENRKTDEKMSGAVVDIDSFKEAEDVSLQCDSKA